MKFIKQFEDFLSEELYDESIKTARYLIDNPNMCFSTHRFWDKHIVRDSFPVLLHSIGRDSELFAKLKNEIFAKMQPIFDEQDVTVDERNLEFVFYYWTRFSYIPWHNDANYRCALTIYLNEEWDSDWGGYFLHRNRDHGPCDDSITAIAPRKNAAVLQYGGVMHSTTAVNYDGGLRITLQAFFSK